MHFRMLSSRFYNFRLLCFFFFFILFFVQVQIQNVFCFLLNKNVPLKKKKCDHIDFLLPYFGHVRKRFKSSNVQQKTKVVLNLAHYDFNTVEKKWQIIWNTHQLLDVDFQRFNRQVQKRMGTKECPQINTQTDTLTKRNETYETEIKEYGEIELEGKKENRPIKNRIEEVKRNISDDQIDIKESGREKKFYVLDMFPYPSSDGLHVGHILCFTVTDIICKFKKMNNFCVFHPIGWDSFGMPCDRLSMKLKKNPKLIIKKNIQNFKEQLLRLGFLFNWASEINTSDATYFKWTQWIIIQMLLKKMAYRKKSYVNWSHLLKCVISNDELKHELNLKNCGNIKDLKIQKVKLLQWYLRITKYARRLLNDLDSLDWPQNIKNIQKNWIKEKKGILIKTKVINYKKKDQLLCKNGNKCDYKYPHVVFQHPFLIPMHFVFLWISYATEAQNEEDIASNLRETKKWYTGEGYQFFTNVLKIGRVEDNRIKEEKLEKGQHYDFCVGHGCFSKGLDNRYEWGEEYIQNWKKREIVTSINTNRDTYTNIDKDTDTDTDTNTNTYTNIDTDTDTDTNTDTETDTETDTDTNTEIYTKTYINKKMKEENVGEKKDQKFNDSYVSIFLEENVAPLENDKIVVSVNHPNIKKIINNDETLLKFVNQTVKEDDTSRLKNENLHFTGSYIFNPISNKQIPIYVGAYILDNHKKYLFVKIEKSDNKKEIKNEERKNQKRRKMYELLYSSSFSKKKRLYNLRDWLFSRQRYWGEPFPFLYKIEKNICNDDEYKYKNSVYNDQYKYKTIKGEKGKNENIFIDSDLPLCLPKFDKQIYEQEKLENSNNNTTSSKKMKPHPILSRFKKWMFVEKNNVQYKRECNIMPQWAGSSWYYLRYLDSQNEKKIFKKNKVNYWLPVDLYVGGSEHAVLHLLYSRFFHKFLYDLKLVKHKEPFQKLFNQGLLLNVSSFYFFTNLKNEPVSAHIVKKIQVKNKSLPEIKKKKTKSEIGTEVETGTETEAETEAETITETKTETKKQLKPIPQDINDIIKNNTFVLENGYKKFPVEENLLIQQNGKYFLKGLEHIEVEPVFEKMSKSRGNTVNPNDLVKIYGADCLRFHILFLGPIDQNKKWTLHGIKGSFNFLKNIYAHFLESKNEKKKMDQQQKHQHIYKYKDKDRDKDIEEDKERLRIMENYKISQGDEINFVCRKCKREKKDLLQKYQKIITPNKKEQKQKIEECIQLLQTKSQMNMKLSKRIKRKKEINIEVDKKQKTNYYIKAITKCIETMKLNTAVSFFMKFFNEIKKWDIIPLRIFLTFIKLLYPFCPHICEEFHFYYLKKYKKELKKKSCYLCNAKWLLYYEKWPRPFKIEEEKTKQTKIDFINQTKKNLFQNSLKNTNDISKP